MQEREIRIVMFSEQAVEIAALEQVLKIAMPQALLHSCPLKTSTEEILLRYAPHLIFVDFESYAAEDREYLMMKLERIAETIPLVGIFSSENKLQALDFVKRGIRDILERPIHPGEVQKVIDRFRRDIAASAQVHRPGKIYSFFSFKGGVGNTFITLNTAASLAQMTKKKVLLWDMALQAGDIPFFLNYKPEYTAYDLLQNLDQLDKTYLEGLLPPHPCGISILPAPDKIEELEQLTPAAMEKLVGLFLQHFDYILVDCGYRLTDAIIPVMDASGYLFITSTLELISLRSSVRCLDILDRLHYPSEKIKILINRYRSKHESISIEKAKEILKLNMAHIFANDYDAATQSVNIGKPVIDIVKNSELSRQFNDFSKKIARNFSEKDEASKKISALNMFSNFIHKGKDHAA